MAWMQLLMALHSGTHTPSGHIQHLCCVLLVALGSCARTDEEEEEEEDWAPSYVFSLAASPALQLLATSSSDGVVRLFEARPSSRCLKEVAAAQVSSL
jgi:hypothetical protein